MTENVPKLVTDSRPRMLREYGIGQIPNKLVAR